MTGSALPEWPMMWQTVSLMSPRTLTLLNDILVVT